MMRILLWSILGTACLILVMQIAIVVMVANAPTPMTWQTFKQEWEKDVAASEAREKREREIRQQTRESVLRELREEQRLLP